MNISHQNSGPRQGHPKVRKLVDLTRKFFAIACNHEEPFEFTIKEVCDKLAIESRRLYDLINVLEALGIIIKRQGSHYEFIGLAFVDQAVQTFVNRAVANTIVHLDSNTRFKLHELSVWFMGHIIRAAPGQVSLASIESILGLKSSQVRRLYDITNILEGMHLITIINHRGSKPSYSWNNERLSTVCRGIITKAEQVSIDASNFSDSMRLSSQSARMHSGGYYSAQKRKKRLYKGFGHDDSSSSVHNSCSGTSDSEVTSSDNTEMSLSPVVDTDRQEEPPYPIATGSTPSDTGDNMIQIVHLSSPSRAVLTSGQTYLGISRDTPQTRRFVSSLIKLSQEKERPLNLPIVLSASEGLSSLTPQGTNVPVPKTLTDQTPRLHQLQIELRESGAHAELTPLESALDPHALEMQTHVGY